jgi:hypothetical protein
MSTITTNNSNQTDEFGRDLTFRIIKKNDQSDDDFANYYLNNYKGLSWFEIDCLAEEEEEREMFSQIQEERRDLQLSGNYELEEGEIIE